MTTDTTPDAAWSRVSPRYVWAELAGGVVTALVVTGLTAFLWFFGTWWAYAVTVVVGLGFVVACALTPRRVRSIGYQLRDDDLLVRRGILFTRTVAVPYGRMQLVDLDRGPIVRALGLSDLKLVTAAASSSVALPGLPLAEAERLRDRLVELAESRRAGL
ncbi:PH domain-containing protein [Frigoribacterium salinisoli]